MTATHLDNEALSAALDGEATPDEQAHLDDCPSCREQVERLRAVASAVGTPVPPRPVAAVDAAIGAALGASDGAPSQSPQGVVLVDLADRRRAGSGRTRSGVGGRRFAPGVLAAAAVIVVLGAGLLVTLAGRGTSSKSSVTSQTFNAANPSGQATTIAPPGAASANLAPDARGPLVQGGDLGSQSNPVDLARTVDSQLAGKVPAVEPAAPAGSTKATSAAVPCVDQGAAAGGLAGQQPALRYVATVRWEGQDAVVLVFDRPGGGRAGVVMGRHDCRLLTTLPL